MLQAPLFDGLAFDPFTFQQDSLTASEVDIGRREIAQAPGPCLARRTLQSSHSSRPLEHHDIHRRATARRDCRPMLLSGPTITVRAACATTTKMEKRTTMPRIYIMK